MSIYYIYLSLILLIFILIYSGIDCSLKFTPIKIKVLGTILLSLLGFRYIALLILLLTKNMRYLYLLKPLIFLNLLCIPILAFLSLYILARNDKIKFNYVFVILSILLAAYGFIIVVLPSSIYSLGSMGYYMTIESGTIVYGVYLLINTILFLYSITLLGRKNINKPGIVIFLISALITIIELITRSSNINILPSLIIGDVLWIIVINFALYRFKK